MDYEIDTASKRGRLPARKNPFWTKIAGGRGGVSLGYRRSATGGVWIAKLCVDGQRAEERLGKADDDGPAGGGLSYAAAVAAALEWARWKQSALREATAAADAGKITVAAAVDAYIRFRAARSASSGANVRGVLTRHVLADKAFAGVQLSKLRATTIEAWRDRLPDKLAPSTENRILNDVRAALNRAWERGRRQLPPFLPQEIRAGTKARPAAGRARMQILSDATMRRIVEAAFAVDPDGDFGRVILLAAATGARFSQLAAMRVEHVQPERGRVLIPGSGKGRSPKQKPPVAVPVSPDVIDRLAPAIDGRDAGDVLLERWAYRKIGPLKWTKDHRRPWGAASELRKLWAATIEKAGAPAGTVAYALRHASIVRGLRAGLPVRLVAALHDTSVTMIEAHYSAYIADAAEDLARRAAVTFAEAADAANAAE